MNYPQQQQPKKGMSGLAIFGIIAGIGATLFLGSCFVCAGVVSMNKKAAEKAAAASAKPVVPKDSLPIDLNARVAAICRKLEAAGAAKNCATVKGSSRAGFLTVSFDPVSGEKGAEAVMVFFRGDGDAVLWPVFDAERQTSEDYPSLYMTSQRGTTWGQWRINWGPQKWEDCRKTSEVTACAKRFPAEYASAKKIYGAARLIARGE